MKQIQLLLVKLITVSTCVYQSIGFIVRFDNGSEYEGRVEIQYDTGMCQILEYVITNGAQPVYVCRPLGFESAIANDSRDEADYVRINGTIWFDSVSCTGAEYAIKQRAHRNGGQWESIKCASYSGDLTTNNKTQQFCCNIDFQLSSEDSRRIMDGNNINSTLPTAANIKSIRTGLSDLDVNVTIINIVNNYITNKKGSPTWVIVTALAGAVAAVVGFITCLSKGLSKIIPDDLKKKMSCGRRVQGSKSETYGSYTRVSDTPERDQGDANVHDSVDGGPQGKGEPRPSDNGSTDPTQPHQHNTVKEDVAN